MNMNEWNRAGPQPPAAGLPDQNAWLTATLAVKPSGLAVNGS